jgi:hypothetical protein
MAVILKCNCINKAQDQWYGKDMRVHNECSKGEKARCTQCNTERTLQKPK